MRHNLERHDGILWLNGDLLLDVYHSGDCDCVTGPGPGPALNRALNDYHECFVGFDEGDLIVLDDVVVARFNHGVVQ